MKYKIVCITQIYNELRKGNLERFVKYVMPLVDALVVYDDASTDGSYEHMLNHTPYVIRGTRNDFASEINHKKALLEYALKLEPDFIFYLDADEVFTSNAQTRLQELCVYCVENNIDGMSFHKVNLWRSHSWRRMDNAFDDGWFVHLWRVVPGISYGEVKPGLHQPGYPPSIQIIERVSDVQVIHYGFATERALAYKYLVYKAHGQSGWGLDRLLDEATLTLEKVPQEVFPEGLWVDDEEPEKRSFKEALQSAEQYTSEVFTPGVSIICLIYKSTKWLEFVYDQVLRYTDLSDKEFFFVANDANDAVLQYLHDHYIPHVIWNNTPQQRQEWFINNVYRAWNYGATVAQGDYLLFINSDMAFSPGWFERLFEKLNGRNCVSSRLVESGKLASGEYGISGDFGRTVAEYHEVDFLQYAKSVSQPVVRDGGLFMPLLIRKADFQHAGAYPEGNIVPGSGLFNPLIAKRGEPCVSGDTVLMQRLQSVGIQHQTAFDSVVYHFQCGEMDETPSEVAHQTSQSIIICNDYLKGRMGEKVLWEFLLDSLPGSAGVDTAIVGTAGDFAMNTRNYIQKCYPQAAIIIQNATFINIVNQDIFTIAYLQDNLRQMARPSEQQERNLRLVNILVTNSRLTALSYPEFQFEVIPIGVDTTLFKPMEKSSLRQEFGFPDGTIGIFVGDFSEIKGWSIVRQLVRKRKDIFWILVSKDQKAYQAGNCRTYNRIDQNLLARLLNCADFFILGSPVETECLAAVEACMCDVPIVMRNTGVFADFTEQERAQVGIFGEDFEQGIQSVLGHTFSPRKMMIDKGLTIEGMIGRWTKVLQQAHLTLASQRIKKQNEIRSKADTIKTLPLVSILTPAYNRASYLDETIQSVLKQDYPHIEYIVLDDGSTDNTGEVLERYTGRLVWETQQNMGETRTVNKGIGMAHGEIVAVVNSDDPILPGAVSAAVAFLQSHPDILVAYPDWDYLSPDSKVTGHLQVLEYDYLYMVRRHHCSVGPGAFIRRRAFELTGGRDPDFRYVADFEYWLRLGLYGKFARIPRTLATFRVHPDSASVSSRGKAMADEHIRLIKKFYSRMDLPPEVLKVRAEAFAWAHLVAGVTAGSERWLALRHYLTALFYNPPIIKIYFSQILFIISQKIPKPIFNVLQWGWHRVRPILARGYRILKRIPAEANG